MPFRWPWRKQRTTAERRVEPLIGIDALLRPVFDEHPDLRVGWPDGIVEVSARETDAIRSELRSLLTAFRALWTGCAIVVDVTVYADGDRLDVRIYRVGQRGMKGGPPPEDARAALDLAIKPLRACDPHRGFDGTNVGFSLTARRLDADSARHSFPPFADLGWDDLYRAKLEKTSWSSLRAEAYRFCNLASRIATWAEGIEPKRVLIPSVGLCVHPWFFAERGFSVVATDLSSTALEALSHPERLPLLYGVPAHARWEIHESAMWGGASPETFAGMPALEDPEVAARLRSRIEIVASDWAAVPLPAASVDVVFATNALPRGDPRAREAVLAEWSRVIRPNGLVFVAMHNDGEPYAGRTFFQSRGWRRVDALGGERVSDAIMYQDYLSSG
jgi:SAM-dependent methyltransferase